MYSAIRNANLEKEQTHTHLCRLIHIELKAEICTCLYNIYCEGKWVYVVKEHCKFSSCYYILYMHDLCIILLIFAILLFGHFIRLYTTYALYADLM